ncbi:hypothetical protein Ciccas_014382 [Cichlidogyrus casuarinus]|uniref:Uncharacterized protein n=1 Tax=Cichlidogyrus casuarinus TaxID=1844966 RepID=A0ABD2PID3_9PLAT
MVGDYIYLFGGLIPREATEHDDSSSDEEDETECLKTTYILSLRFMKWEKGADMTVKRYGLSYALVNKSIFIFGGIPPATLELFTIDSRTCQVFNTETRMWSDMATSILKQSP